MSKYTLTIETDDATEVARAIVNSGTKVSVTETKVEPKAEAKEEKVETVVTARRGRPPKAQATEAQTVGEAASAPSPAADGELTLADVQMKLVEVARKLGKPAAMDILNKLGVQKSDQLKPEQFEEAIAQALDKLEGDSI